MDYVIMHNENIGRFEILESSQTAYLQYLVEGGVMNMYHTYVPPQLEGRGVGASLAKFALEYARSHNLKVQPSCSFIAVYIKRHKEFEELVV